jgi:hypothetical protein
MSDVKFRISIARSLQTIERLFSSQVSVLIGLERHKEHYVEE